MKKTEDSTQQTVRDQVRAGYAQIATGRRGSCCGSEPCLSESGVPSTPVTERIGYTPEDLDRVPDGANMGLSCGNPTALASLVPGERVLDLGSGGGLDCFIAGPRVGPNGRVTACSVTSSSGSSVLDEAACDGMTRYARYNPALDDAGNPTTGSATTRIVYQLGR